MTFFHSIEYYGTAVHSDYVMMMMVVMMMMMMMMMLVILSSESVGLLKVCCSIS